MTVTHTFPKLTIEDLKDVHKGRTVYIVGTGPSMRLFPVDFFRDKFTIGLNQVWRHFNPTYLLTIHPETLPSDAKSRKIRIVTKKKDNLTGQEPYYFFRNNLEVLDFSIIFEPNDSDMLYVGRGIHTGAMHLAAIMGSSFAVLVGCDFWPLGKDHHSIEQHHVQWHGLDPLAVYREYYYNARQLRTILQERYPIRFLNMNPFLGDHAEEDYFFQLEQLGLKKFPDPVDVSQYERIGLDFTS